LREALARGDHDFILSEPRRSVRSRHPKNAPGGFRRFVRIVYRAADYPNRIAGTCLIGLVIAICVNALMLQQSRHPAPLFHKSVALPVSAPPAPFIAPVAPAPVVAEPVRDPIRQLLQANPTASDSASAQRASAREGTAGKPLRDPISQLLKSEPAQPAPEPSKTVFAAQRALVKLGFVLKPDGIIGGATRQAIEQFERDHKLQPHGELGPKVLHELSGQSGITIE
jgi:hypothetical protein